MSDDISIPHAGQARTAYVHSYRSRRHGLDAGTRRLVLAACGIGVVLLGGMAVWTFAGHRSGGPVPTIEADTRPLRIKPTDPASTPIASLVDATATGANTDLAPQAEQPDPQALLAQRQPRAEPPPASASAPVPAPAASTPAAVPVAAAPAAPVASVAHGAGVLVQLAAVDSEKGAASEWQRLSHRMPELLGGRQSVVQRAEQGGKTIWRVRTGGFATLADATQFCQKVKAKGGGCSLATF